MWTLRVVVSWSRGNSIEVLRRLDCYLHGCPCGYYGDARHACTCVASAVSRYQRRISGPLLETAVSQMELSARAYHRVLKLARTIADLAGDERIATAHLAKALQYRPRVAEG